MTEQQLTKLVAEKNGYWYIEHDFTTDTFKLATSRYNADKTDRARIRNGNAFLNRIAGRKAIAAAKKVIVLSKKS